MFEGKKVIVTGLRATGSLHLGNLLGAIQPCVALQDTPGNLGFFFVANLHTLTTRIDPKELLRDMFELVLTFIAAGIDPEKSVLYAQSSIPETSELAVLLSNIAYVAELQGKSHFEEKSLALTASGKSVNAGLLYYPILMAADILGVQADIVPVGQDQVPHVEFTRDLARRFNATFQEFFTVPGFMERSSVLIPGLGASGKMGKSESSDNVIFLTDKPAEVGRKLRRAVTDPHRHRRSDPGNPAKCNIFTLHHQLSTPEEIVFVQTGCQTAGIGCAECKAIVAQHVNDLLAPIQNRREELLALGQNYVQDVLMSGGQKARERIVPVVEQVKKIMGVPKF